MLGAMPEPLTRSQTLPNMQSESSRTVISFLGQDSASLPEDTAIRVKSMAHALNSTTKTKNRLMATLAAAFAIMVVLVAAIAGSQYGVGESLKESHVAGSALVGIDGVTVQTGAFKNYATLYDLPKFDVKTILETKQVTLMLENNQELAFTITGAMKRTGSLQATFLTPGGTITVDSVTRTASACVNGKRYKSAAPAVGSKSQRRLLLERAPRLYAHGEFFGVALAHEHGRGRSLGVKDNTNEGWASMAVALKDALTDKVDSKDMVSGSATASSGGVEMSVMYAFNAKKVLDDDTSCGNSAPIGGVGFTQKVPFTYKNAPGEFSMLMTTHDTVQGSLEEHLNATSHQWSVYVDNLRSKKYAHRLHASRRVYPASLRPCTHHAKLTGVPCANNVVPPTRAGSAWSQRLGRGR